MAWTTPRTWVTSEVVTASVMNTHVRDNLNETAPAKAATAGRHFAVSGTNAIAERAVGTDTVSTSETTTSTSFTDLATSGPSLSVSTSTRAFILLSANMSNNTAGASSLMGYAVSGATTLAASDTRAFSYESGAANDGIQASWGGFYASLTAGTNTFTAKYRVTSGTGTFLRREITLLAF